MRDPAASSTFVAKVVMWIVWVALANGCVFFAIFLTEPPKGTAAPITPSSSSELALALVLAVFAIAMGLRFLFIPRIRNPWTQLLPYVLGVILAQQVLLLGLLMLKGQTVLSFALSAAAMLSYFPLWIRPKPAKTAPPASR